MALERQDQEFLASLRPFPASRGASAPPPGADADAAFVRSLQPGRSTPSGEHQLGATSPLTPVRSFEKPAGAGNPGDPAERVRRTLGPARFEQVDQEFRQRGIGTFAWSHNALRESGGNPNAVGDGGRSHGLFQFNFGGGVGSDLERQYGKARALEIARDPVLAARVLAERARAAGVHTIADPQQQALAFTERVERPAASVVQQVRGELAQKPAVGRPAAKPQEPEAQRGNYLANRPALQGAQAPTPAPLTRTERGRGGRTLTKAEEFNAFVRRASQAAAWVEPSTPEEAARMLRDPQLQRLRTSYPPPKPSAAHPPSTAPLPVPDQLEQILGPNPTSLALRSMKPPAPAPKPKAESGRGEKRSPAEAEAFNALVRRASQAAAWVEPSTPEEAARMLRDPEVRRLRALYPNPTPTPKPVAATEPLDPFRFASQPHLLQTIAEHAVGGSAPALRDQQHDAYRKMVENGGVLPYYLPTDPQRAAAAEQNIRAMVRRLEPYRQEAYRENQDRLISLAQQFLQRDANERNLRGQLQQLDQYPPLDRSDYQRQRAALTERLAALPRALTSEQQEEALHAEIARFGLQFSPDRLRDVVTEHGKKPLTQAQKGFLKSFAAAETLQALGRRDVENAFGMDLMVTAGAALTARFLVEGGKALFDVLREAPGLTGALTNRVADGAETVLKLPRWSYGPGPLLKPSERRLEAALTGMLQQPATYALTEPNPKADRLITEAIWGTLGGYFGDAAAEGGWHMLARVGGGTLKLSKQALEFLREQVTRSGARTAREAAPVLETSLRVLEGQPGALEEAVHSGRGGKLQGSAGTTGEKSKRFGLVETLSELLGIREDFRRGGGIKPASPPVSGLPGAGHERGLGRSLPAATEAAARDLEAQTLGTVTSKSNRLAGRTDLETPGTALKEGQAPQPPPPGTTAKSRDHPHADLDRPRAEAGGGSRFWGGAGLRRAGSGPEWRDGTRDPNDRCRGGAASNPAASPCKPGGARPRRGLWPRGAARRGGAGGAGGRPPQRRTESGRPGGGGTAAGAAPAPGGAGSRPGAARHAGGRGAGRARTCGRSRTGGGGTGAGPRGG